MEEARSYYDAKAKAYDDTFSVLGFRVLDAITWMYLEPYVPARADAWVLDAGGGTGHWATRMANKGCRVVLIDTSKGMLEVAAQKIRRENLEDRIILEEGDITRTGHKDKSFDLVFCEQALFLFNEPDALMREMHRILKSKARLIITAQNCLAQCLASLSATPNTENVDNALAILRRERFSTMAERGKVRVYTWTPSEFRSLLKRNRFRVEKVVGKGISFPLRISKETFMTKEYSKDLFDSILRLELALCERPDALGLAGHLQAIARKA